MPRAKAAARRAEAQAEYDRKSFQAEAGLRGGSAYAGRDLSAALDAQASLRAYTAVVELLDDLLTAD